MQAFVFVDTNVLLHFQFFDEVDWHSQLGVTGVTLVFAPVVFAELDRHKWCGSRREKARAKSVLKKISALELSMTAVSLRLGVDALALDAEPPDALFAQHRLQPQANDDRLLASLLGFCDERPGSRVMILSADSGLGVKARSRRIEIVAPADSLELPDEPDDVEREHEEMRRELNEIMGAAPDLALTFGDANTHANSKCGLLRSSIIRRSDDCAMRGGRSIPMLAEWTRFNFQAGRLFRFLLFKVFPDLYQRQMPPSTTRRSTVSTRSTRPS